MSDIIGVDVSTWQGVMNWQTTASKARFAFIRAGSVDTVTGRCYYDYRFKENAEQGTPLLPCGTYWYWRPQFDVTMQAQFWAQICLPFKWQLPPVIDVETTGNLDRAALSGRLMKMIEAVRAMFGRQPIIYTRQTFFDPCTVSQPWNCDLWAARYMVGTSPWSDGRYKFRDWQDWRIWQFSADGNGRGKEFGASSTSIDIDLFHGNDALFREWAGIVEPTPAPLTLEERVASLEEQMEAVRGFLNL